MIIGGPIPVCDPETGEVLTLLVLKDPNTGEVFAIRRGYLKEVADAIMSPFQENMILTTELME